MNFIPVIQIISGDEDKLKLGQHSTIPEGHCAGSFDNDTQDGHEAKASHYIFDQPWQQKKFGEHRIDGSLPLFVLKATIEACET